MERTPVHFSTLVLFQPAYYVHAGERSKPFFDCMQDAVFLVDLLSAKPALA
jgi:hypothetical protein